MASLVLRGAATVVPMRPGPLRGQDFDDISVLENATVVVEGDRIVSVGADGAGDREFDASGCTIVPGFVDCHTHVPFFGWRADEDAARLAGRTYEAIHGQEGGIFRSARLLAEASDEEVLDFSFELAIAMLTAGTTTFETKSGYGLSVDAELRQLRLATGLARLVPQTIVHTCLAAHAVPPGKSQGEWIGEASEELLPAVASERLAGAVDLYVESIAFALEHAARLSEKAKDLGLRMRVHADQLADNQTASFAARWGFASADHLNHTSVPAVGDLAEGDTAAVLLPGATFTLRQAKKPPARELIEAGAVVALGTDLNPGTSPIHSMPFVVALACRLYGLKPLEALAAATVNSAHVLGLDEVGHLSPGARADIVVLDLPSFDQIAYRPDHNPVVATIIGGELRYVAPAARDRVHA